MAMCISKDPHTYIHTYIHTLYTCPKQKVLLFKGCTCRFMEQRFHSNSKTFLAWAVCFPNTFSGPKFIQIHVTTLNF